MKRYQELTAGLLNDLEIKQQVNKRQRVGFYRFRGELGKGAFFTVKLAQHELTGEIVAMKTLTKTGLSESVNKLVQREVEILARLQHPNIIYLYQVCDTSSAINVAVEYASYGDLQERLLKSGKFAEKQARLIFVQILSAVTYLHSKEIAHRDLKAENVLLVSPSSVKLSDFGFSTFSQSGVLSSTVCGSPSHMAPEVVLGDETPYSALPADVWSLGVLLYNVVCGHEAFKGDSLGDLIQNVIKGKFSTPVHLSSALSNLLRDLIQVSPDERPKVGDIWTRRWLVNHGLAKENTEITKEDAEAVEKCLLDLGIPLDEADLEDIKSGAHGAKRILQRRHQNEKLLLREQEAELKPTKLQKLERNFSEIEENLERSRVCSLEPARTYQSRSRFCVLS